MSVVFNFFEKPVFCSEKYLDSLLNDNYKCNAKLIGWLYFKDLCYFTLDIKSEKYLSATPLMFIKRTIETGPYSCYDNGTEDIKKYPYLFKTEGCDDGAYGWRFKTEKEANTWLNNLIADLNTKPEFEHAYEFFDYYDENLVSFN